MGNILELFGVKEKTKFDYFENLCYFIRFYHINPLTEEFEIIPVYDKDKIVKLKIKKFAMDLDIFNRLMEERNNYVKRENEQAKKGARK